MKHYVIYQNMKDRNVQILSYLDKATADFIAGELNRNVMKESRHDRLSYKYTVVSEIW